MQHTYVGPTGAYTYWYGHVGCDFDEETGELYLAGRHLGGAGWKGDLISFNTVGRAVGGTTNAWTELIDGSDKTTDFAPYSVIYRDRRGSTASPHPTVLLPMSDDDPDMTREFYRDQVDGNGNLLEVQTWAMNDVAMGQLDEVNGTVWMGSPTGGIWGLKANDTLVSWDTGGWPGYWLDADSPYYDGFIAPVIAEVDPDPKSIPLGQEYVEQLLLAEGTAPVTWTLLAGPTGAVVDSGTGRVSGWTPGLSDIGSTISFEVKANNGAEDTEAWQVTILSPVITEVTPDPKLAGTGIEYTEQLTIEDGTPPLPTWELLQGPTGAVVNSSTGRVSGWTPGLPDMGSTFTFEVKVSEAGWQDTETWNVQVRSGVNGFCVDCLYACQDSDQGGDLSILLKADGTKVGELQPSGSNWATLTFAGRSKDNDVRLFAARLYGSTGMAQPRGTIEIAELDSSGTIVNSVLLTTLTGALHQWNDLGNIRYNRYHDTLMVSSLYGADASSRVDEIDLGLSATVVHRYFGPGTDYGQVACDLDEETGALYLTGRHLGSETGPNWRGDVVSFNTVGRAVEGTTNTYTVLVDGPTMENQTACHWDAPISIIYRAKNNPAGEAALLICGSGDDSITYVTEVYRDQTYTDGNLLFRGEWVLAPEEASRASWTRSTA